MSQESLPPSLVDRLSQELSELASAIGELAAMVPIKRLNSGGGGVLLVGWPDYYYDEPGLAAKAFQSNLSRRWREWSEAYKYLTDCLPPAQKEEAYKALLLAENWIDLGRNYAMTRDATQNGNLAVADALALENPLNVLRQAHSPAVTIVPDTNALVKCPEFANYTSIGGDKCEVVLLPTVLGELDKLKVVHRNEDFRKKVEGVVNRLKEMRRRGDVVEGVAAAKSVRLRFMAREPRFETTLSWLDASNMDDRIIASSLELQRENPSAVVILVTGDINLQNKAASARLPYAEPPAVGSPA